MSDEKPYFDEEKQKKAIEWLNKYWVRRECEICRNSNWSVADFFATPLRCGKDIEIGGRILPQLVVTCTKCGNTKYFNAIVMGLFPQDTGGENHG